MTKHSLNYVVQYINTHLNQGHSLPSILDHLKEHHVDNETMHAALETINHKHYLQMKEQNKSVPSERFIDLLRPAEYLVGACLAVILFVTIFGDTAQTIAFLLTLVFVGYAYLGSSRVIEPFILVTGTFSVISVMQQFSTTITLIYGSAYAILVVALHKARRSTENEKIK